MKITHIYHSGFVVELEELVLIFDWYTGRLPAFSAEKPVYCLVSHSHGDHYGSCIWSLREQYQKVYYILDRNVRVPGAGLKTRARMPRADVVKVRPHQSYEVGEIQAETLLSTDQGVAFLAVAEGKVLYHAGDLNIWYWDDEPERENNWQIGTYRKELERIADRRIDCAFVPVDPRLGDHGTDGAACFLERVGCGTMVPMHFWEREAEVQAYLETPALTPYREKILFLGNGESAAL